MALATETAMAPPEGFAFAIDPTRIELTHHHLMTMRKEDWLRLAMPASITLLAMAIVATPLLSNAQISQPGNRFDPIYVKLME